jgi:uncharacterized protein
MSEWLRTEPTGHGSAAGGNDAPGDDLVRATLRFCRLLRERGVATTPAEAVDAVRALEVIDLRDRRELYLALRAVLVVRVEDYRLFDELFDRFWRGELLARPDSGAGAQDEKRHPSPHPNPRRGAAAPPALEQWVNPEGGETEPVAAPAFGDQRSHAEKDFSAFSAADLEEIARLASRLARRLTARPSRRWRAVRRGPRVHPRQSLRRAYRTGGELVELAYRERRLKKTRLVLLCDVSGSMDLYSRFLLQFLYALQNHFSRVESFVFSTHLTRVTEQLRGGSYRQALQRLSGGSHGWSGGTRIGESLAAFHRDWPRLTDHRTIVIVLSDGWDTGEPEMLSAALHTIRRRAGKVIWLNPLLGNPDYQPLTRGMQAALPYVDVFTAAHNLASLERLVRHLSL